MYWIKKLTFILFLSFLSFTGSLWAQHKLQIQFSNFGQDVGRAFFIRAVDLGTGSEVGREMLNSIPAADFNMDLWVLINGHSYRLDFFADFNQNGAYDAPPADHAFSVEIDNVNGDLIHTFSYNSSFADINWPAPANFTDFAGTWTGYWENRTYQTTAEMTIVIEAIPDSTKIRITSTTSGVFGNPETLTQTIELTYDPEAESIEIPAPSPWTGSVAVSPGDLNGSVTAPDYGGITLNLDGNFGPDQLISEYIMSGAFQANGIIVMTKESNTGVRPSLVHTIPDGFILGQNFPNPFNPETTIPFSVREKTDIELTVYDIMGRQIEVLVNETMPAGSYEIRLNGSEMISGIYFYKLKSNEGNIVRKMIRSE